MSKTFFTPAEIADAAGDSLRKINRLAQSQGWRKLKDKARKRAGRGGGWEYHVSLLPDVARARLTIGVSAEEVKAQSDPLWSAYEKLSKARKEACARRLTILDAVDELLAGGMTETAAITYVAKDQEVSARSIRSWRKKTAHVDKADRLPALADGYKQTAKYQDCHPEAWTTLKSDYLRPEEPSFSACYRRVKEAAKEHGWKPLPNEQSLRRRFFDEIPEAVIVAARKKSDALKNLYPAQRRDRSMLHAMEAVNMDGHRFDVFIRMEGEDKPVRIHLIALQDLYSNKMVAWRLSISENKDVVRLVIGDMVERHGIPEKILLDNGRAFASKSITGGTKTRFRFKIRDEDPQGLLTALGIQVIWATPYAGQSKPIERTFRDLCDDIAKHPFCSGAYTGNRPDAKPENYNSRAIPFDDFANHVERMIAEHNARSGRTGGNNNGRSFDQTFTESLAQPNSLIRWPTTAQRALWLLASERISTKRGSGEIHLFGNRYWSVELNQFAGKKVTVRFDPDHLTKPIHVYDIEDRLICIADCIADAGFFDVDAAREHNTNRKRYIKTLTEQRKLETALKPVELARIYGSDKQASKPEPEPPVYKKIAAGGQAVQPVRKHQQWTDEHEDAFGNAMQEVDANVLKFPKGTGR